jgi:hypothetical protein
MKIKEYSFVTEERVLEVRHDFGQALGASHSEASALLTQWGETIHNLLSTLRQELLVGWNRVIARTHDNAEHTAGLVWQTTRQQLVERLHAVFFDEIGNDASDWINQTRFDTRMALGFGMLAELDESEEFINSVIDELPDMLTLALESSTPESPADADRAQIRELMRLCRQWSTIVYTRLFGVGVIRSLQSLFHDENLGTMELEKWQSGLEMFARINEQDDQTKPNAQPKVKKNTLHDFFLDTTS